MRAAVDQSTKQMTFWVNSWHLTVIRQQIFVVSQFNLKIHRNTFSSRLHPDPLRSLCHSTNVLAGDTGWSEREGKMRRERYRSGNKRNKKVRYSWNGGYAAALCSAKEPLSPSTDLLLPPVTCPDSLWTSALYKSFTYLLTYLFCSLNGSLVPPPGISCSLQGPLVLRPGISSAPSTDLLCPLQGSRAPSRNLLCSVQGSTVTLQLSQIRKSSQDSPQWQIYQSRRIPINTHSRYRYIGYTHLALAASMSNVSFVSCLRNFIIAGMSFCQHHTNNIASHKQYHI